MTSSEVIGFSWPFWSTHEASPSTRLLINTATWSGRDGSTKAVVRLSEGETEPGLVIAEHSAYWR